MTYEEAMMVCKAGNYVRHAQMGEGWSVFYIKRGSAKGFYCLNPHTGSNYQYRPSNADKQITTWSIYRPDRKPLHDMSMMPS